MDFKLKDEEMVLVMRVLLDYLSDLKMEISNTENYEMREEMKQDEVIIKAILLRMGEKSAAA